MTAQKPTAPVLRKLSFGNIWRAWRIASEIFESDSRSILNDYVGSLLPASYRPSSFRNAIEHVHYYLAFDGSDAVGVSGLYVLRDQPDEAWVGWYGVSPALRGRGMGRALLLSTIELARSHGHKVLRLWTTENFDLTIRANEMYKRMGFSDHRTIYRYDGQFPILTYSLALTEPCELAYRGSMIKAFVGSLDHIDPRPTH